MFENILDIFGFDIFSYIWNFITSILSFFGTLFSMLFTFLDFLYYFNPVIFVLFALGAVCGLLFGILKIIKLVPFL